MTKKVLALLVTAGMMISLIGCGSEAETEEANVVAETMDTVEVGAVNGEINNYCTCYHIIGYLD